MKPRALVAAVAAVLSLPFAVEVASAQTALTAPDLQIATTTSPADGVHPAIPDAKPKKAKAAKPAKAVPAAPGSDTAAKPQKAKAHAAKKTKISAAPLKPIKKGKGKPVAEPLPSFADQPQETGKLSGSSAWGKLVGNSLIGRYDGQNLVDAYLPDGTVKTKLGDAVQVGRWGLVDDRICFQYPDAGDSEATCWSIEMQGSAVTLTGPDGNNVLLSMTPGLPTDF